MTAVEVRRRRRNQPAPPHIVFEALTDPDRDPGRRWLRLVADEQRPVVVRSEHPHLVVWSSLWPVRPDAQVRFDLPPDGGAGTDLCWTLTVEDQDPDPAQLGHWCKRLNVLINAELRYSFGQ